MSSLIPCIISGGAGTRLWPVSRASFPKPFMRLPDDQSLLQKTFQRAAALPGVERVLIVTGQSSLFRTLDECQAVNARGLPIELLLEPLGRNTAPAIAAAALEAETRWPGATLLVLPADHLIQDEAAFDEAAAEALRMAQVGHIVAFGLRPERAETGFGYIEAGERLAEGGNCIARFVEKPDAARAEAFLADGRYLWNSGMFCSRADVLNDAFSRHAPEVREAVTRSLDASPLLEGGGRSQRELDETAFRACPDISFDYAVMEKADNAAVLPCSLGWSDIGSWDSYAGLYPEDANGNRLSGEVISQDSHHCFIQARGRLIAAIGLRDLVIVDTPDALLVADRARSQEVREVVAKLKQGGHQAGSQHRTAHRPWGYYTVLEEGESFKIKRILVKPGASLSLQMHHHRSEHWIVVSGTAQVTNGEAVRLVHTNQSTFIPAGERHRLYNPGRIDLVMIEVQSGQYLGEDDIVRFNDDYGRATGEGARS
ncbi:mannose-1-phosphate guanylyltransferase/mannose-6-phosphate isomerase [uncultured Aquitalea sp.]|uniref:mannose-1-phosphate guanylyltransferase/mannose-6-phosphate isomerase n=1 Tax=uncultured Aquitalea sp. TaxID=540272 RepID=UPI0025D4229C|nr:mannose-1-phosphate guanylyltransferase/mannose-6-phosphate isomerase [uncultured Aquitalea sp.]